MIENKEQKISEKPAVDDPSSKVGGMWIAVVMIGLLVLIIGVEMLRSNG